MRDFFVPGRGPAYAGEAMIATSHPLATAAGLEILGEGGNAVDAALAAVAVQCVVDPLMTGIGGDCFALYAPAGGAVLALNGSGRAPAAATVERLLSLGVTSIGQTSPHAVTVPGAIAAWTRLHADHGRTALDRLFRRAIDYAENGYPITPRVAFDWEDEGALIAGDPGGAARVLPGGRAPRGGGPPAPPLLAPPFRAIAAKGAAAFYEGPVAASLVRYLNSLGGLHTLEDFARGKDGADYVAPIATRYRDYEVLECPPNGQGLAALMILNMLDGFDLGPDLDPAERIHLHAEATKLAYHHRDALIGDPATMPYPPETLLSTRTTAALRARIDRDKAGPPALFTDLNHPDTVYLCVVDRDGNAISLINSIFHGFGSTRLDPATGILLHSRGASFQVVEGHPNAIGPNRRPMHTIIPGLLRRHGRTVMPFGVMGGQYQAAGHAALLSGLIDCGLDVQAAIDAPRSFAYGGDLLVEPTIAADVLTRLAAKGHHVVRETAPIGGAQAIWIDHERGLLAGGSDQRKDGCALGF